MPLKANDFVDLYVELIPKLLDTAQVSIDDYRYEGKKSRIRLIDELADDLERLSFD